MDRLEGAEKEVQGGEDMYLTHFVVQEKPTRGCKVTIPQYKKKKTKEEEEERNGLSFIGQTLSLLPPLSPFLSL